MKKNRQGQTSKAVKKSRATLARGNTAATAEPPPTEHKDLLDDKDSEFGGWLKSEDGRGTMKLFVLANSIVLLTTLASPHVQAVLDVVYDSLYGPEPLY